MSQPTTSEAVQRAMQLHGEGRLQDAQALYEQALAAEPEHPDALHLLGVLHAQRGRHAEAHALITRAIAAAPGEAMFRNNLGNVALELGHLDEAERCYVQAIELAPDRLDALNNLGVLLSRRGQLDAAERVLRRVVELAPDFRDAHNNLAAHWMRQGRYQDAVDCCVRGLLTQPRGNTLRRLLAAAYGMLGMNDKAIEVYRGWLAVEPNHPVALYHLQALLGEDVPERAPDAYVTELFDRFAASFDAKLEHLGYRAPQAVADALARAVGPSPAPLALLDAGCGTGLCGPLLAPLAGQLVGVDLSQGMLRKAGQRGLYHALHVGELVAFLQSTPEAWDAVVSADTLCYFGRLEAFAAAAAGALRDGGWLVFTVESLDAAEGEAPFQLHGHGRYSHRRGYVEQVLRDAGFVVHAAESLVLRQEGDAGVSGWLVSAQRAARH